MKAQCGGTRIHSHFSPFSAKITWNQSQVWKNEKRNPLPQCLDYRILFSLFFKKFRESNLSPKKKVSRHGSGFLIFPTVPPMSRHFRKHYELDIYRPVQPNWDLPRNMPLIKNPQFLSNFAQTFRDWSSNGLVNLSKFEQNWTKIVDFSLMAYFLASLNWGVRACKFLIRYGNFKWFFTLLVPKSKQFTNL